MTKKILIAGAGGLIGKALLHHFNSSDFEITVLTRELRNSENSFNKSINFVKLWIKAALIWYVAWVRSKSSQVAVGIHNGMIKQIEVGTMQRKKR